MGSTAAGKGGGSTGSPCSQALGPMVWHWWAGVGRVGEARAPQGSCLSASQRVFQAPRG